MQEKKRVTPYVELSPSTSIAAPQFHWIYPKEDPNLLSRITKEFNVSPVIAQILISRGFRSMVEIHHYFYAKLPDLFSPSLLPQIDRLVDRLYRALQEKEGILIYGDNDVDGVTGTVLLVEFLKTLGAKVSYNLPNREELKGSFIEDAIETAKIQGCTLIITVDCGVSRLDRQDAAHHEGIDVLITDHHEPSSSLSDSFITLNPKLPSSSYPNRDLTGVGVAFKLVHALANFLTSKGLIDPETIDLKSFLDLVAIGTVADMGPLKTENRILVRYGLMQIPKTGRLGLLKLISSCDIDPDNVSTSDIASKIAPRLNSLGRISDAKQGAELLLTRDFDQAKELVEFIEKRNEERQKIERKNSLEIELLIQNNPSLLTDHKALVLYSEECHPGVIAIIAARIAKVYNRPTVIITKDKGVCKGSVRTIAEFAILPILRENDELFLNYGGHDFAAGFTILPEQVEPFKKRFLESVDRLLSHQDLSAKLHLDARVSFQDLTFDFFDSLSLLSPFGIENPAPTLYSEVWQLFNPKIVGKQHLKFYLEEGGRQLEGIGFNLAHRKGELYRKKNSKLLIAFTPYLNSYHDKTSIHLQIRDFVILS